MGCNLGFLSGEHGHWVKPKSITIPNMMMIFDRNFPYDKKYIV
jgi:hypothetical protein